MPNTNSAHLAYTTISRESLDISLHSIVDASLKDLRIVYQRLQEIIAVFSSELRLLERIYYKGKNQHRAAVFWRKVTEIRRICTKISGLGVLGVVEDLRYTFYDTQDAITPKVLRRPWNQVPSVATCTLFMDWLSTASQLVNQARSCFRLAHQSFTQQVQTGSFLPLGLALISILSRLDFVVAELQRAFELQWQALQQIPSISLGSDIRTNNNLPYPLNPFHAPEKSTPSKPKHDDGPIDGIEDFGYRVPRSPNWPPTMQVMDRLLVGPLKADTNSDSNLCGQRKEVNTLHPTNEETTTLEAQVPEYVNVTSKYPMPATLSSGVSKKTRKRKTVKDKPINPHDEIDDIFGV